MLKMIKYDFIKKYKLILIVLITAILLNLLEIIKMGMQGSVMFLGLFPFAMILLYIVDIIRMYSDDLNKKSGYMLFMTSNSGYKIIVSKVITAILEALSILLLYFIFILINAIYISVVQKIDLNINELLNAVNIVLSGNLGINLGHIFVFLITVLSLAISFILTAYTAITIRKSIFSEIKFGGLFSFIIFIALNWLISYISDKLSPVFSTYINGFDNFGSTITATQMAMIVLPVIVLSTICSALMTLCSGYLLEKKINL